MLDQVQPWEFENGPLMATIYSSETFNFSLRLQNGEYPTIFQVMGANQNAWKLLSTDLVNTNNTIIVVNYYHCIYCCRGILLAKLENKF